MINASAAYKAAAIADSRRTLVRATVDLVDPDIVYGAGASSGESDYSELAQIHDDVFETSGVYATLERNRWTLDGTFDLAPPESGDEVGFESSGLSDDDCDCNIYAELQFTGVSVLQAAAVYFSDADINGVPSDFTISIYDSSRSVLYTESFSDNTDSVIKIYGFTAANPTAIRVAVTKTSLPYRRLRIIELVPGLFEIWGNGELAGFSIVNQVDFSAATLPYGTCQLVVDNSDKRFSPQNKSGLFLSLEDRQEVKAYIGFAGAEYRPVGVYYQYSQGWNTSSSGLTMTWNLVDIIGLVANKRFNVPPTLPMTLAGWIEEILGQIGAAFTDRYTLDGVSGTTALETTSDKLEGVTCGELLLWICQKACCFPRASSENGYLTLSTLWSGGNDYALDNLSALPVEAANADLAAFIFKLHNEITGDYDYAVLTGNNASPNTISIDNPFITTTAEANTTAAWISQFYGGNTIELTGRGEPTTEAGDVISVELDNGDTEAARVKYHALGIQNGVLAGCKVKGIVVTEA